MHNTILVPILYTLPSLVYALHNNSKLSHGEPLAPAEHNYSTTHAYDDDYQFNSREGWETIAITDEPYKYIKRDFQTLHQNATEELPITLVAGRRSRPKFTLGSRSKKTNKENNSTNAGLGGLAHLVDKAWNSLKGIGKAQDVFITWYTGQDLQNPSCWPNSGWAPTDESFACALTLEGWTTRPKCFQFLEICNGRQKCIFVRVVDTCAGCAKGSKHVDLTKRPFSKLADLEQGKLTVQMRVATKPKVWHADLWGPKD